MHRHRITNLKRTINAITRLCECASERGRGSVSETGREQTAGQNNVGRKEIERPGAKDLCNFAPPTNHLLGFINQSAVNIYAQYD